MEQSSQQHKTSANSVSIKTKHIYFCSSLLVFLTVLTNFHSCTYLLVSLFSSNFSFFSISKRIQILLCDCNMRYTRMVHYHSIITFTFIRVSALCILKSFAFIFSQFKVVFSLCLNLYKFFFQSGLLTSQTLLISFTKVYY